MMVFKENDTETLTPFHQRVLKDYQKYTSKYRVHGKNAHLTIRRSFLDWLAQPLRQERYQLETMPVHEQVELTDKIVSHLQSKRTKKMADTREENIKRSQVEAAKKRQSSFDF